MINLLLKLLFFILNHIQGLFDNIFNTLNLKRNNVIYNQKPIIQGRIIIKNKGLIKFGNNLLIINSAKYNPVISHPTTIATLNDSAKIIISENVGISGASIVSASNIFIEKNVNIGGGVCIWDTDFHPVEPSLRKINKTDAINSKPIIIEENVFIGARAIILKGVKIGRNSVIAAGSVVTCDVSQNSIYAGIPAKKIKSVNSD